MDEPGKVSQCDFAPISGHGRELLAPVGSIVPKQEGGQTPGSALGERPSFSFTSLGYAETRPRLRLGLGPNGKGATSRGSGSGERPDRLVSP
jgi:hypothetical protein